MKRLLALSLLALAACTSEEDANGNSRPGLEHIAPSQAHAALREDRGKVALYMQVIRRVEPVAEAHCRMMRPDRRCDFQITIDNRADAPSNAYQTEANGGRPILAFTLKLLQEAQNADEMAFILGHEAAHHIRNHLPVTSKAMTQGALASGVEAAMSGASKEEIEQAQHLGGLRAVSGFSQNFELEADALGAIIAHRAGFDAVRGAAYFNRIPDPRNRHLSTHPPNSRRLQRVRDTIRKLED